MQKRVIIVHGWQGRPQENWLPWLKAELESQGYNVAVPQLPNADDPRIADWIPALTNVVGQVDGDTYFVGHSMGCQAIVRCIASLPYDTQAGGAVFVAGFFKRLTGLEDSPKVQAMDKHWLTTPVDFTTAHARLPKSIAIFSDDDPYVPLENQKEFKEKLGSKIIIEHNQGHFSGSKYLKLPVALNCLLKLTGGV